MFCSSWMTLVAMTIYSFHRLIIGKVDIGIFLSQLEYLDCFTELFIE